MNADQTPMNADGAEEWYADKYHGPRTPDLRPSV
jgi:hypothetical protein